MKLSIHILQDWLGNLVKESKCRNSQMNIENIRLYSADVPCEDGTLYVGTSEEMLRTKKKNIVCKSQKNYILLNTDNLTEAVNRLWDAYGFYTTWSGKCKDLIHNQGTLDELLALSTEIFPTPIIVVDSAQIIVAVSAQKAAFQDSEEWKEAIEKGSIPEPLLKEFNLAYPDVYQYKHVFAVDPQYFFVKGYCKHIFVDGARRASVILKVPGEDYTIGKLQIFDYYTDLIRDWIISCGESKESFNIRSHFSRAVEGDKDALATMKRQTTLFGWAENCPKLMFLIAPTIDNVKFEMQTISAMNREAGGMFAMIHKNTIVLLVNSDIVNHADFNNLLNSFVKQRLCYCAISFMFTDMKLLVQAYQNARDSILHNPAIPGIIYHSQDISLRRVAKILNEQASSTLNHPALAVLRDYDKRKKSDYYNTLFVYLKNERKHQNTSQDLFIHRNTLVQRLHKIQEIWPIDLESAEERFHLLLSFYKEMYADES